MKLACTILALPLAFTLAACGESTEPLPTSNGKGPAPFDPDKTYAPTIDATKLTSELGNPLFPAPAGASWVYEGDTDEGHERIEVTVLAETQSVFGVDARVVRDTVFIDDAMAEDTLDWYAQDDAGNVWYLGEDTHEFEGGKPVSSEGSWTAGVDGALPGVVMLASPAVGDVYRQEYLAGEAEDVAQVVAVDVAVTVSAGSFTGCVKTRDRSAIDPDLDEFKYYCPGVGLALEEEGDVRVELVQRSGL